ncbi:hypothetical protein [Actinoallomurus iriomotensis]|uniref:CHAT domain-containing protein n=1 Tax=Actinoallomurus iriomotensis TaxID=478107 RepID=A0A9W6W5X5_9ACTN|nr:hypothetical protein [Actinoallomurus iriomotensis]GLY91447.1 hypothetical protein Airi02_093760 [Actinoallomurus iriomotensis]
MPAASHRLPTKANVLAHLPDCAIAHFACHGRTDPTGAELPITPSLWAAYLHSGA